MKVLKENLAIEELGLKDEAQPVRLAHIQIGDKLIRLREAFDTLDSGKILSCFFGTAVCYGTCKITLIKDKIRKISKLVKKMIKYFIKV